MIPWIILGVVLLGCLVAWLVNMDEPGIIEPPRNEVPAEMYANTMYELGFERGKAVAAHQALEMQALEQQVDRLRSYITMADTALEAALPLVHGTCEPYGTCKDCLEDGRGNHSEQVDWAVKWMDDYSRKYGIRGGGR